MGGVAAIPVRGLVSQRNFDEAPVPRKSVTAGDERAGAGVHVTAAHAVSLDFIEVRSHPWWMRFWTLNSGLDSRVGSSGIPSATIPHC
jgi:hypothetical protein